MIAAAPDALSSTPPSATAPSRKASAGRRDERRDRGLVACRRSVLEAGPAKSTMNVEQFCSASRVVIVAGKGGVGKTTVTAAARDRRCPRRSQRADRRGGRQIGAERHARLRTAHLRAAAGLGSAPGAHLDPRRGAPRVPRGAGPAPHLATTRTLRSPRRRRHRRPGHEGHPRARQGQAARAGRRRGPNRPRRAGGRARGELLAVGPRPARRGANGAGAQPGRGGARAALRPAALPGRARDARRGDPGRTSSSTPPSRSRTGWV